MTIETPKISISCKIWTWQPCEKNRWNVSEYVAVLKHLAAECKFNEDMQLERLRNRLVSGIHDKKMMTELLKLKLEELTFDIAVAKCIAIEQSYKDVEAEQSEPAENPVKTLVRKEK